MKIDFSKFNAGKLLPLLGGVLTLAGMVVSNKIDANNRNDMKAELKDEIVKDLLEKNS